MLGIVGKIRRRFCIFGDTVNMASRTETSCPPCCIQLTEEAHSLAAPHVCPTGEVLFEDRGGVAVKGSAAPIRMFLASQGVAGGGGGDGGPGSSGEERATSAAAVAPPLHEPEDKAKEPTSFGSTLLPRLGMDSSFRNAEEEDGSQPGLVIGQSSSASSSVIMGSWD